MNNIQPAPAPAPRTTARMWILTATIIGSSMTYIDSTVVSVTVPVLQRDFGVRLDQVQWVVAAYTLFVASLVLLGGTLGDRVGRRRVYSLGVALYALASAWCGAAPTIGQLIAARALQGIGGALLVPGSLAIITASFDGEERGRAIGTWSGLSAVSTAIGPLLGGWLVDHVSWRAVFFINVPLAAVVLWIASRHLPELRDKDASGKLDWPGALAAALGFGGLVYGLIEANVRGFADPLVLAPLIGGALLVALFIVIEKRSAAPMMPLTLFRSRNFAGANLLTLLLYAALSGMFFMLGLNLMQVQRYSATGTGAAFLPFIVVISTLSRYAGAYAGRHGARGLLIVGPLVAACGFAALAIPGVGGSYWTTFLPGLTIVGLGMALTIAPLTTTVMNAVSPHHAGTASGVNNAITWIAGLMSVALLGISALGVFRGELGPRLDALHLAPAARSAIETQSGKLGAIVIPATLQPAEQAGVRTAIDESFVAGFRVVMLSCAALAALSALMGGVMVGNTRGAAEV